MLKCEILFNKEKVHNVHKITANVLNISKTVLLLLLLLLLLSSLLLLLYYYHYYYYYYLFIYFMLTNLQTIPYKNIQYKIAKQSG